MNSETEKPTIKAKGFAILHPMNGGTILPGDIEKLRGDVIRNATKRYGRDKGLPNGPEEMETWNELMARLKLSVIPVLITDARKPISKWKD